MSTPTLLDNASRLLLAKVQHATIIGWDIIPGIGDETQAAVDEILLNLAEKNLLTIQASFMRRTDVMLTGNGEIVAANVTPEVLCGEAATGSDRANAALWLWLILHGYMAGSYGGHDRYGTRGEIAHLLLCGLNLAESGAVRDDTWTEWNGTFGDGNRKAGVSGYATCNCDEVLNTEIVAEVESITALLRQILGVA